MLKHYKTNTKIALAKTNIRLQNYSIVTLYGTRDWSRSETKVKLHRDSSAVVHGVADTDKWQIRLIVCHYF